MTYEEVTELYTKTKETIDAYIDEQIENVAKDGKNIHLTDEPILEEGEPLEVLSLDEFNTPRLSTIHGLHRYTEELTTEQLIKVAYKLINHQYEEMTEPVL